MQGILLAAAASLCYGTAAIFVRLGLRHIRPSTGTFFSVLASLLVLAPLALLVNFDAVVSLSLAAILWFCLIGVINYFMARQSNYHATKYIGVARSNPILSASPLFAMTLAVIFLGETVNALIVMGTICILAGLFLLVSGK